MIKDVLVCLEGSPSSETATRVSIEIALALGARVAGMAIVDEPTIRAGAAASIGSSSFKHERDEALLADAHARAADWLALFERRCREAGVPARPLEVVGRPDASILEEMERHDITVIGRDANFKFETEASDERTLATVLYRATRPVLLVPEAEEAAADRARLGNRVLIAYDGSGAAKRAIESFATSGLGAAREIHVATVDDNGAQAYEMASRAVEMLRAAGFSAVPHNVVSLLPTVDALFDLAGKLDAGLMVMGAFAHSRLAELFSRSVTRHLVESATIPLYLKH